MIDSKFQDFVKIDQVQVPEPNERANKIQKYSNITLVMTEMCFNMYKHIIK